VQYNFTDRVRKVLALAREEARALRHDYVGTEHILLGLLAEGEGVAVAALVQAGVQPVELRQRLLDSVRPGKATLAPNQLPYTSRSKRSLEYAMQSARELGHPYVGDEHLLLGLLREEKSIAAQVLVSMGCTLDVASTLT
jgi:ATP-dependent Clp protease ATP-binding subunit ClpC